MIFNLVVLFGALLVIYIVQSDKKSYARTLSEENKELKSENYRLIGDNRRLIELLGLSVEDNLKYCNIIRDKGVVYDDVYNIIKENPIRIFGKYNVLFPNGKEYIITIIHYDDRLNEFEVRFNDGITAFMYTADINVMRFNYYLSKFSNKHVSLVKE